MPFREGNFGGNNKEQNELNEAYYGILGMAEGASQYEIKKAYREKSKKCHPDRIEYIIQEREKAGQEVDRKKLEKELTEKFKNLENAYSILSKRTNGSSQQEQKQDDSGQKKEKAKETNENPEKITKVEQRGHMFTGDIFVGVRADGQEVLMNAKKEKAISKPFDKITFTGDELILGREGSTFRLIDPATDKKVTEKLQSSHGFKEIKISKKFIVGVKQGSEVEIIKVNDYRNAVRKLKDSYRKGK